jgi:hypothetical protein
MSNWEETMSKKKSYMDKDNIISEGLWTDIVGNLLAPLVPKSVGEKWKQKHLDRAKALRKEIERLEKEVEASKKRQTKSLEDYKKKIEKETGKKIPKSSKDIIANYYKKRGL